MDQANRPSTPRNRGLNLQTGSSRPSPPGRQRDQCLAYLDAVEAIMRGHILQLESLASLKAWMQDALDETSPALQAARAIECSIASLQTILRGNIALVYEVRGVQSQSASLTMRPPHYRCWLSQALPRNASQDSTPDYLNQPSCESASHHEAVFQNPDNRTTPDALACPTPGLRYHRDVLQLPPEIKLFEPHPSPDPSAPPPSRRIVLANLPPGVTAAQVLRRISARITSIAILHPRLSGGDSTRSCLLEFATPEAAAIFSRETGLLYKNTGGHIYRATAWRIPTPSFRRGPHEARMLDARQTRTLAVRNLPENRMRHFLRRVGARAVVDARRAGAELVVELASIREAARVVRLERDGAFADLALLDIRTVCDAYARGRSVGCARGGGVGGLWEREPWPETEGTPRESVTAVCETPSGGAGDEQEAVDADEAVVKADEARCSWEEYGRLARRRRDEAEAARLRGGDMPAWWGNIKSAGVPAVVSTYLDTSRITIVDTAA